MNGAYAAKILNKKRRNYKEELRLAYVEQMSLIPIDALFEKTAKMLVVTK